MEDVKQNKIIEDRISDTEYVEELPEDYKEVAPGTEGTNVLEENNIEEEFYLWQNGELILVAGKKV